jgi:hypothetical protein
MPMPAPRALPLLAAPLLLLLSMLGSIVAPPAAHAAVADPKTSPQALPPVCGTWALQQALSTTQLRSQATLISAALTTPGVRGLSIRVPWSAVDTDLSLLDEAHRQASAAGKPLSVRFMAGRWTPARVFTAGAYYYVNSAGERIPKPFSDTGVAGNPVFEAEYDRAVARLAAWSRTHGVGLLHLPWYGHKWAEIDNGPEVRASRGYSVASWLAGHQRLVDIGLAHTGSDLSIEFAMSGHWGPTPSAQRDLANHVLVRTQQWTPLVFVQGNGLGVTLGSPTTREIFRGMQMYGIGDYDWAAIYQRLDAIGATYVEVYTNSFASANRAALAAQIPAYNARFDASCRWI